VATDAVKTPAAIAYMRRLLAEGLGPRSEAYVRQNLVRNLMLAAAPSAEIVAQVDSLIPRLDASVQGAQNASFYTSVAGFLLKRRELLPKAEEIAAHAVELTSGRAGAEAWRSQAAAMLGRVRLEMGDGDSALAYLEEGVAQNADSAAVLVALGRAYDVTGMEEAAINAYVRSLGAYGQTDSAAMGPLRTLWLRRNGEARELERRIAAVRAASQERVLFSSWVTAGLLPAWTLPALDGGPVSIAHPPGSVVLEVFWGSWCEPCKPVLAAVQRAYERFRDQDVTIVSIAEEMTTDRAEAKASAMTHATRAGLTFPVAVDSAFSVARMHGVDRYPTIIIADRHGRMRFRIAGMQKDEEVMIRSQIDSLLVR